MVDTTGNPLELILQLCNSAAPSPWYPSVHAKETGITRASLDPYLDRLRLAGLVRLTDWMPGTGQGYVLTQGGKDLVANPKAMDLLRSGNLQFEVKPQTVEPLLEDAVTKKFARSDAVLEVFDRRVPARMTLLLIAANFLVFAYGFQLSQKAGLTGAEYMGLADPLGGRHLDPRLADVYVAEGALTNQSLVRGQWWRLLTSCFIHLGFVHLAGNMLVLYFIGGLTERMWGPGRYLVVYLLSGLAGACAMARFDSPNSVGGGASGAIWGLMISVIAWVWLNKAHMPRQQVNSMLRRLFNLVVISVLLSLAPGISLAAHLGGGAGGVAASLLMHGSRHGQRWIKVLSNIGALLLPFACLGALYASMRSEPQWEAYDFHDRVLSQMVAAEKEAEDIRQNRIVPVLKRRLGALTEEELSGIVQSQKDVYQAFSKGLEVGKQTRPYRDKRVEEARQQFIELLERRISENQRWEWQTIVNPAVRDEIRLANLFLQDQLKPLLDRDPATRERESLEKIEKSLQEQIAKVGGLRELLDTLGPLDSDPGLEESRKEDMDQLSFLADLFTRAAAGLREGSKWPEAERKRLDDLIQQFRFRQP